MPSYLDLGLLAVILISALLSMLRGFTREVLAIASWVAAAAAAYYFHPLLLPYVRPYISKPMIALGVAAALVFFITLIIVSIITVKLSDAILDSKVGALDRSLGFLFGVGRGYLLCVIAFVFFAWLVPTKSYPVWVQNSKTKGWLEATGASIEAMMPDNLDSEISNMLEREKKKSAAERSRSPGQGVAPAAPAPPIRPGQRSEAQPPGAANTSVAASGQSGIDALLAKSRRPASTR
ncbi:MAG TPA: CvpA family protein [Beijerinckiaceae bacterium]|nr:CvpA family protein [Beijerinckiaceae bacterium]